MHIFMTSALREEEKEPFALFFELSILHEVHHFMKLSQHVVDNLFTMIMCNSALKG